MGTKKNPNGKKSRRLKDMPPKPTGGAAIKGAASKPTNQTQSSGG